MKVFNGKVNDVDVANLLAQSEFTISDGSKLIEMILDNAYKDPITATVREICQNASEVDPNFSVHLPTDIEPWLAVVDNGTGLSHDDVIKYASGIGASTKDGDNTKVGGFGIGMKVPFTMSDQYLIISRFKGMVYTFSAYKDEDGKAQFIEMNHPAATDELNGLEVRVPVEAKDFTNVKEKLESALMYFNPKPTSNIDLHWVPVEYWNSVDGEWGMRSVNQARSRVIMGNLWYEIDSSLVRESYGDHYAHILQKGIDLILPIGAIKLPLSREGILYNDQTVKILRDKLDNVKDVLTKDYEATIQATPNLWEAMKCYSESNQLINQIGGDVNVTRNGLEVNTSVVVPAPILTSYMVNNYRWRQKTLQLSNHEAYVRRKGVNMTRITYNEKDKVVFLVNEKGLRMPSRLLSYMKDGNSDADAWVFVHTDGERGKLKQWLLKVLGITDTVNFEDIPDITTTRSASVRRKIAKVTKFKTSTSYYDKSWWEDAGELDMDTNTGIYVDTLRGSVAGVELTWASDETMGKVMSIMKQYKMIPTDTVLYGCPGSHKNKLKDHANFIHMDEAIKLALEVADELITPHMMKRYTYMEAMNNFSNDQSSIFSLDIDIKGSYYSLCRKRVAVYEDVKQRDTYSIYIGSKKLRGMLRSVYKEDGEEQEAMPSLDAEYIQERIKDKFTKRYPLLPMLECGYSTDYTKSTPHIAEYITMKENYNV